MSATSTQFVYLERDPNSSYQQLSIKGRRIRARTLYGLFKNTDEPMKVDEIAAAYELPIDAVREAIAYCESKPAAIEEDVRSEEALMEATGMNDANYKFCAKPKLLSPQERAHLERPSHA